MPYVEVRKSGTLVTRRRIHPDQPDGGWTIHLGDGRVVQLALGQSATVGEYDVRVLDGEPGMCPTEPDGTHVHVQRSSETFGGRPSVRHARPQAGEPDLPGADARPPASSAAGPVDDFPTLEGYQVVDRLGEGGMGVVWRARELGTNREVALKLLATSRMGSRTAQARFEREVELAARLEHSNIARVYHSGVHQGMYYYAMELTEGLWLDRYVEVNRLSQRQVLDLMRTVCRAVHHAHQRGVLHRDLKPSNIIVSPDGQPHVLDFGLARALLEDDRGKTISMDGEMAGTLSYMAPEQAAGRHGELDAHTDVYALGVVLFHLLTGQFPHDPTGSRYDVARRIVEQPPRRPREIRPDIDRGIEAVLVKALARAPADRYADAGQLADDIERYLAGQALQARVASRVYLLRRKLWRYRRWLLASAAAVLVLAATAVGVYWLAAIAPRSGAGPSSGGRSGAHHTDAGTPPAGPMRVVRHDGFEQGIPAGWTPQTTREGRGRIVVTNEAAHGGKQAVRIEQQPGGGEHSLVHTFDEPFQGTVSVWMMVPEQSSSLPARRRIDPRAGAHGALAVTDGADSVFQIEFGEGLRGDRRLLLVGHRTTKDPMPEAGQWHKLTITLSDEGAKAWFDDELLGTANPAMTECRQVKLLLGWSCGAAVLWDDFEAKTLAEAAPAARSLPLEPLTRQAGALARPWQAYLSKAWRVEDGDLIVSMGIPQVWANALYPALNAADYSIRCRYRHDSAALAFIFRYGGPWGSHYRLTLDHDERSGRYHTPAGAKFTRCHFEKSKRGREGMAYKQDAVLATGPYAVTRGQFHDLRIDVHGTAMTAYVDGRKLLSAADGKPNPPKAGGIGLSASTSCFRPCRAVIRDLRVVALDP